VTLLLLEYFIISLMFKLNSNKCQSNVTLVLTVKSVKNLFLISITKINLCLNYNNKILSIGCYLLVCTDKCVPFPNMILLAMLVTQ